MYMLIWTKQKHLYLLNHTLKADDEIKVAEAGGVPKSDIHSVGL